MSDRRQRRMTAGAILIALGLGFFLIPRFEGFQAEYVLLGLGVLFMAGYFVRRRYGLLVAGGILLGLGLGEVFDSALARFGDGGQLGLGLGFVSIYAIALAAERRSTWWPLIPGGLLILSGLDRTEEVARYIFDNWPLALVVIGILLVLGGLKKGGEGGD